MKLKFYQVLLFALIGFISCLPLMGMALGDLGTPHGGGGGGP
jgi:hypothetical protein